MTQSVNQFNSVGIYENVAGITKQMLQAAKQQDWDGLAVLEQTCAAEIAGLKLQEDDFTLEDEAYSRKLASIKSILADDREIRDIILPWMVRLDSLANGVHTKAKLTRRYIQ